jgi:hypothetical protein
MTEHVHQDCSALAAALPTEIVAVLVRQCYEEIIYFSPFVATTVRFLLQFAQVCRAWWQAICVEWFNQLTSVEHLEHDIYQALHLLPRLRVLRVKDNALVQRHVLTTTLPVETLIISSMALPYC